MIAHSLGCLIIVGTPVTAVRLFGYDAPSGISLNRVERLEIVEDNSRRAVRERRYGRHDSWESKNILKRRHHV